MCGCVGACDAIVYTMYWSSGTLQRVVHAHTLRASAHANRCMADSRKKVRGGRGVALGTDNRGTNVQGAGSKKNTCGVDVALEQHHVHVFVNNEIQAHKIKETCARIQVAFDVAR